MKRPSSYRARQVQDANSGLVQRFLGEFTGQCIGITLEKCFNQIPFPTLNSKYGDSTRKLDEGVNSQIDDKFRKW